MPDFDEVLEVMKSLIQTEGEVEEIDEMLDLARILIGKYSEKIFPLLESVLKPIGGVLKPMMEGINDYTINCRIANIKKVQKELNCDLDTAIFVMSDLELKVDKFTKRIDANNARRSSSK